jgi:hypothetical protein
MKNKVDELETAYHSKELLKENYSSLAYMMAIDYQTYLVDDILQKVDRATMTVSLEGREPYLDHRIIDWAAQLPDDYKYHDGSKKYICIINNINDPFWSSSNSLPYYLRLNLIRDMMIENGSINQEKNKLEQMPNHYYTIRNLHPHFIYFMFFYKINKQTLELQSFSEPFIIAKNSASSFLNFPLGLTTYKNEKDETDILLSYGDGDCESLIVSFKNDQTFSTYISKYNNNTNVIDIDFNITYNIPKYDYILT